MLFVFKRLGGLDATDLADDPLVRGARPGPRPRQGDQTFKIASSVENGIASSIDCLGSFIN